MVDNGHITRIKLFRNRRVYIAENQFTNHKERQGTRTGIENFSDVVEARIAEHTVVGSADEECEQIDNGYQPNSTPIEGRSTKIPEIQHEKSHDVGKDDNNHVSSQNPYTWQGVAFMLSKYEVAKVYD
jgi:hypothetical protein